MISTYITTTAIASNKGGTEFDQWFYDALIVRHITPLFLAMIRFDTIEFTPLSGPS